MSVNEYFIESLIDNRERFLKRVFSTAFLGVLALEQGIFGFLFTGSLSTQEFTAAAVLSTASIFSGSLVVGSQIERHEIIEDYINKYALPN